MFKNLGSKLAAGALLPVVMLSNSHAAVDAAVTTALTDGMTDGKTIAYAVLALVIVMAIIVKMRRAA